MRGCRWPEKRERERERERERDGAGQRVGRGEGTGRGGRERRGEVLGGGSCSYISINLLSSAPGACGFNIANIVFRLALSF